MKTHKDLDVWKGAVELATEIYELTKTFPKEELFGLVTQMRRAAVSIASNISEGAARKGNREFVHLLYLAAGSASELDTQLEICGRTIAKDHEIIVRLQAEVDKIIKMLFGLIRSLAVK